MSAGKALDAERRKHEKEKKSHGLIVNQFFSGMIAGGSNEETIESDSKLLGLSFCGTYFGMAVLALDNVGRFLKPNKPEDLELLLFSLKNLCCEVLESEAHRDVQVHVIQYNHRINLLFNFPHANLEQQRQDADVYMSHDY